MTAPTLRAATPADAAAIADLARRSFTDTFGHLYDPADLALFLANHSEENWAAQLDDPAFAVRVAAADGALVAYCKLGPPSLPFTPPARAIELRQLYVLAPFHGSGVAAAMMAWALETARARDAASLYLSVFTGNARARRFYARHGFEEVGPYAFKVGNHVDEDIVMRCAL